MKRRIHNVGNRVVNTYVYRIADGWVMIDTGYANSYHSVICRLEQKGIKPSEIRYVFLTHAHDDHAGFLNELMTDFPDIKVIAHEKAMSTLLRGQNSFVGGCSGKLAWTFCQIMKFLGKGKHRFPSIENHHMDRFWTITQQDIPAMEQKLQGRILFTSGHMADSISLRAGWQR